MKRLDPNPSASARRLAKRAERRRTHLDKYANKRVDDRSMDDRLAALATHFNGGRA